MSRTKLLNGAGVFGGSGTPFGCVNRVLSGLSYVETEDDFLRVPVNMDDIREDSAVELVEADENDNDVGLTSFGEANTVEVRESRVSEFGSITYDVMICGGSGCSGGRGGMKKLMTGPIVTCLKYVVK